MQYFRRIFITCLILVCCFSSKAWCERVLPVFAGFWYEHSSPVPVAFDSCRKWYFYYPNKDKDKTALINVFFSNLPILPGCQWGKPYLNQSSGHVSVPDDFPSDKDDYQKIISNSANPRDETWRVDCTDNSGWVLYYFSEKIYPSYQCPDNSRISFDEQNGEAHCSTTPQVCDADVVGRDLDSLGVGMLGHVGLTSLVDVDENFNILNYGNYVVEVLNNPEVINLDTLQSFEHPPSGSYWGEVYAVNGSTQSLVVKGIRAQIAVIAGLVQKLFNPEYTLTVNWQEGGYVDTPVFDAGIQQWKEQNAIIPAIFRCDTFVNYCYSKGFGLTIPISDFILPLSTYNSFIYQRLDVPPQLNSNSSLQASPRLPVSAMQQKQKINNLLEKGKSTDEFARLDFATTAYLHNPAISRADKLTYFWQQAQLYVNDTQRFSYLLDNLAAIRAAELVPYFINSFNQQNIISNKAKLISAIARSVGAVNSNNPSLMSISSAVNEQLLEQNSILAQSFILNELQQEQNTELLRRTINYSATVIPMNQQNYQLMISALQRLKSLPNTEQHFSLDQENFLILGMAFATPEMQASTVPLLLDQFRSEEDNVSFAKQIAALLKYIPPQNINPAIKSQLDNYLEKIKPPVDNLKLSVFQSINDINWLFAYAAVNTTNPNDQKVFIRDQVLRIDNPLEKARLFSVLDKSILKLLSNDQRVKLIKEFDADFKHTQLFKEKLVFVGAIDALNQQIVGNEPILGN